MIKAWEIHIETTKNISDILEYYKSKGVTAHFRLCAEDKGGMITIKHPQKASLHTFKIKPYTHMDGVYVYEVCTWSKEEATLMEDWFKDI